MTKWSLIVFIVATLFGCSQRISNTSRTIPFYPVECTPAKNYGEMDTWNKETGYDVLLAPKDSLSEASNSAILFLRTLENQHYSILFSYFDCLSDELQQSLENKNSFVFHIRNSSQEDNAYYSLSIKSDTIRKASFFMRGSQY